MTNEDPDSYSTSDATLLDLMGHQTLQEESGPWGAVMLCCVHQKYRIVYIYRDLALKFEAVHGVITEQASKT